MVVQHNISAMNANRMLGITSGSLAKSTEKLSSGYKVNRAADDAAGLSISEKMRKQIRGLDQASANAEDGISAVQTAEGALTEVHDMLQRMNELAVKAANGTMSLDDRQTVQDEVDQLLTEIDRVAETTKFNETYLLKGDKDDKTVSVAAHDAGLSHAAHFYNAMPVVYKEHEFKVPGTVESVYALQDMTVEVIADGIHVPPVMLQVVYQIKGVEKTALITDSLAYAASEGNVSSEPSVILEDGVCKLADHSALAGSIATMDTLIRTCIQKAEIPMIDVFRMASETPAKIMGIYDRKGSIEEGKDADIMMFNDDINLTYVMQMGHEVTNEL